MKRKIFTICFVFLIMLSFHALAAETEPVEEWVKRYNSGDYAFANALAVDSSGNVFVTGSSGTIKYDANGNELWIKKRYDRESIRAIAVDSSGRIFPPLFSILQGTAYSE